MFRTTLFRYYNGKISHLPTYQIIDIDPSVNEYYAIEWACKNGHVDLVKEFLLDKRIDDSKLVSIAVKMELWEVLLQLLKAGRIEDDKKDYVLKIASVNNQLELVKDLLKDGKANPSAWDNYAIWMASRKGYMEVVKALIEDGRADPSAHDNDVIIHVAMKGNSDVLKMLLKIPKVDPTAQDNFAIQKAIEKGYLEVLKALLEDVRVDPAANLKDTFLEACRNGHFEVVKELFKYPERIDLNAVKNKGLYSAILFDRVEVVKVLLENGADLYSDFQSAIHEASREGHCEVVKLLLKDNRINLSSSCCRDMLINAVRSDNVELVKILVEDTRFDPSDSNYLAITHAIINDNLEVLKILLQDQRVNIQEFIKFIKLEGREDILKTVTKVLEESVTNDENQKKKKTE